MIANGFVLRVGTYLAIKNLGFTRAARRAICRGTVAWRKEERERIYPTSSGVAAADSLLGIEPPCCHTSFRNNGTVEEQEPVCLGKDVFQKNLVASHGVLFSPAPFPRRKPDVMKEWAKPKPQLLRGGLEMADGRGMGRRFGQKLADRGGVPIETAGAGAT